MRAVELCSGVCVCVACVAWPRAVLVDERCAALDESLFFRDKE